MNTAFLHISDVHLGYQQYGQPERFEDFGRAFLRAIDFAVNNRVRFVLISGDLFHKSAIDPPTLLQAIHGLDKLKQEGIPVIAITGNHDSARYRDKTSWLELLSQLDYLCLLSPIFEEDQINLIPWDGNRRSYIDIDEVRIFGIPHLGASIRPILEEMPNLLKSINQNNKFTILMAHFGLEGELPFEVGGVSPQLIVPLRGHIDYLALGHWHKPYERDGWIFNPGSLETCSMNELNWRGGYYYVQIHENNNQNFTAELHPGERRSFYRFTFQVDEYLTPEKLYKGLKEHLLNEKKKLTTSSLSAVVEVGLEGLLPFDRRSLDIEQIKIIIEDTFNPLIARPQNNTRSTEFEITTHEELPRSQMEFEIYRDLILRDSAYQEKAEVLAKLMGEVKTMVLIGSSPEAIISTVKQRIVDSEGN
jgi:DNA repair protein SbcD/Mre11